MCKCADYHGARRGNLLVSAASASGFDTEKVEKIEDTVSKADFRDQPSSPFRPCFLVPNAGTIHTYYKYFVSL